MKTGGKILLAALGLVVAAGLLYIADWLWLGATVRGEALRAFELRGADGGADSDFYFEEADADLRLGIPGAFHDFRQAVVVLKYSYEADRTAYEGEEGGEEPYEDYDGDEYAYMEEDGGGYAYEGGPEDIGDDGEEAGPDGEDGEEYLEAGGEEEYFTERVTANALATFWLEFRDWRWQIVDAYFLYE